MVKPKIYKHKNIYKQINSKNKTSVICKSLPPQLLKFQSIPATLWFILSEPDFPSRTTNYIVKENYYKTRS